MQKRRDQNRRAQRAYRARLDGRVRGLKERLETLSQQHQALVEWSELRSTMIQQREGDMKKLEMKVGMQTQLLDSCLKTMAGGAASMVDMQREGCSCRKHSFTA